MYGVFVHKETNEAVPYISHHARCEGIAVITKRKDYYECLKCGRTGLMITVADELARSQMERVGFHAADFVLDFWNKEDFKSVIDIRIYDLS